MVCTENCNLPRIKKHEDGADPSYDLIFTTACCVKVQLIHGLIYGEIRQNLRSVRNFNSDMQL